MCHMEAISCPGLSSGGGSISVGPKQLWIEINIWRFCGNASYLIIVYPTNV